MDVEKGSAEPKASKVAEENTSDVDVDVELFVDPLAEKKLVTKLDLYIAPVMTLIFLASYLDRANIGNAASAGMTADLNLKGNQLGSKMEILLGQELEERLVLICMCN
jgi:hypothetical protein